MKKILIVEDELIVRSIYRRKFEMSGYQVETAEEGTAALNLLPTFKPDAVQVDIMLPGMDGVEVIRQIRAWPEYKSIPILVISSFYRPDLAKDAWKAGATKCVSKMDCTPNLALELVEQMLSGENAGASPFAKLGTVAMSNDSIRVKPADSPWEEAKHIATAQPKGESSDSPTTISPKPVAPSAPKPPTTLPHFSQGAAASATSVTPVVARPDPGAASRITLPTFARPTAQKLPKPASAASPSADDPAGERERAASVATPDAAGTASRAITLKATKTNAPAGEASPGSADNAAFRIEIRQEFLRRAPQIQTDLRDRVAALLKSKSTTDQIALLHELEASVSSLASLSGITGFSRISHLSGAIDALIKDLHKKPAQMTNSVLRTIAHASDCLNMLFRDLERTPRDIPQSMLILVVDDEPIARRTISVALSKANLRCISILPENPFDLIFLDAEMPGLNGYALCTELRKLPTNKTTPVIFVTSLTKFEVRAQSSLAGANDLIAKPFLMMELAVKALTYLLKPQPIVEAKTHSK
jgi:CheY-like chemotaxis protein